MLLVRFSFLHHVCGGQLGQCVTGSYLAVLQYSTPLHDFLNFYIVALYERNVINMRKERCTIYIRRYLSCLYIKLTIKIWIWLY